MDQYVIYFNPLRVLGRYRLEHWTSGPGIAIETKLMGYSESILSVKDWIPGNYTKRDRLSSDGAEVMEVWVKDEKNT